MPALIEDYALVGDGHTAALIAKDGSVDWLCWPRFDSGACFAALVGTPEHGRWLLAPAADAAITHTTRRYRGDTLILETDYESADGAVTVIDFMPPGNGWSELVRIVVGRHGTMKMRMELVLRFDYGFSIPWVTQLSREDGVKAIAGPDTVVLRTSVPLTGKNLHTLAEFTVSADERVPFSLGYAPSHLRLPPARDPLSMLARTENYWLEWSGRCQVHGRYEAAVRRSLITLKALAYEPTGGIVAAPTTSLPEHLGGTRNWDYRYCWLRDATITLLALMRGGHYDEARAWRAWLGRVMAGSPEQIQIMYGIAGERRLPEMELDWLPGYQDSKPVRVGNGAANQLQLDVFGEVMAALHLARVGGLQADDTVWSVQCTLLDHLEKIWRQPDEGIWETRGGRRHFTFSKVMAWVAFDRAIKSAEMFRLPGALERWRDLREQIHADVCANAWHADKQAFTQSYGSDELDASVLLLPQLGFLPPDDPRIVGTIDAIERELLHDGLVLRYRTSEYDDGLPPGEGTFLACSFWLVDAYALLGRIDEAHRLFRRLLSLSNDLGLLAEEYDPVAGRLVGNFPQAFSHVALVHTAMNLMHHEEAMARAAGQPEPAVAAGR
ncbi:glycoside hydrolase family 15 protein [Burkholderia ubonensis]|uniref:Trehalase n=1 Tax=Burkholderia ubonensis TaxID=101571 RepID=A0AB74D561_9BURK|nr:glycoside hydrolase family 15 protein [Burkholderia ubonensis]PAJ82212.1 glucoamylase [Burkholderia ubonensis]PAJ86759.1 glucoamylase [Burkholderia ubonensis]PAK02161.1 glucoamylase [Burkholderia ubonensis]PAK07065.1 glucoamylase [Burkholderia ubonensis]PAK15786.1 glucoamylase [Burkholderia ubonensis]